MDTQSLPLYPSSIKAIPRIYNQNKLTSPHVQGVYYPLSSDDFDIFNLYFPPSYNDLFPSDLIHPCVDRSHIPLNFSFTRLWSLISLSEKIFNT